MKSFKIIYKEMKKKINKIINLLNLINNFIIKSKLIKPKQHLLIAISAGQDSISILCIYFIIKNQWNLQIKTIYCNHLLQKETFYTFFHLSKIFFTLNIHFSYSITLIFLNSEQKGRNWRLNFYKRILNFLKIDLITTGHTKSDQIETFIFNLIRGSGLEAAYSLTLKRKLKYEKKNNFIVSYFNFLKFKNLKKKKFSNKKHIKKFIKNVKLFKKTDFFFNEKNLKKKIIIRPLLLQSRFDTQKICGKFKFPVFPDKSNQKKFYSRNRIRKQLLPTLRFFFNPQIDLSLWKFSTISTEEEKVINNLLKIFIEDIITENKKIFCFNLKLFDFCPLSIQRKVCFIFFQKKLSLNLNYYIINKFIKLLSNKIETIKKLKKKNNRILLSNWFFFPQIGFFYFYKTILIIVKNNY